VQGFFEVPVDHMTALPMLAQYVRDLGLPEEVVAVAPDTGRTRLASKFAEMIGGDLAVLQKDRPAHNVARVTNVIGDIEGKCAVMTDDMVDTAGTLVAGADTINNLMQHVGQVAPKETVTLLNDSLQRLNDNPATSIVMTLVGFVIALWATTGAMNSFMTGLNIAYERKDSRSFMKKRIVAVQMTVCIVIAFLLVFGLLVLGPQLSQWVGNATGASGVVSAIWWAAQWPVLIVGLLAAFATLLYLGPDVDHPEWQFVTPGAIVAVFAWLAASGLFAVYTSMFGSYNKTWGSLAAVIIMLTWLWLTGLALLFGAELNAEVERSRELRLGEPAEVELQAPAKA